MNQTLGSVIGLLIGLINQIVPVLITLGLVLFTYACVRYVMSAGEGGESRRSTIVWSLIALFVVVSIWGILRVLCTTLIPGGTCGG